MFVVNFSKISLVARGGYGHTARRLYILIKTSFLSSEYLPQNKMIIPPKIENRFSYDQYNFSILYSTYMSKSKTIELTSTHRYTMYEYVVVYNEHDLCISISILKINSCELPANSCKATVVRYKIMTVL